MRDRSTPWLVLLVSGLLCLAGPLGYAEDEPDDGDKDDGAKDEAAEDATAEDATGEDDSSSESSSPKRCPGTARDAASTPLKPVGT